MSISDLSECIQSGLYELKNCSKLIEEDSIFSTRISEINSEEGSKVIKYRLMTRRGKFTYQRRKSKSIKENESFLDDENNLELSTESEFHDIKCEITKHSKLSSSSSSWEIKSYAFEIFNRIQSLFDESENIVSEFRSNKMVADEDQTIDMNINQDQDSDNNDMNDSSPSSSVFYETFSPPSCSQELFFYSPNKNYIIKSMTYTEKEKLLGILWKYYLYLKANPSSLLVKIFSLHRLKMKTSGTTIYFMIMENILRKKGISNTYVAKQIYDLKGSTVMRYVHENERRDDIPLKDENVLEENIKFRIHSKALPFACCGLNEGRDSDNNNLPISSKQIREYLLSQIRKDSEFLASFQIMDYSLLIAVLSKTQTSNTVEKGILISNIEDYYCCGIIDILQTYNLEKKMAHYMKSMRFDSEKISTVEPHFYASRFYSFFDSLFTIAEEGHMEK